MEFLMQKEIAFCLYSKSVVLIIKIICKWLSTTVDLYWNVIYFTFKSVFSCKYILPNTNTCLWAYDLYWVYSSLKKTFIELLYYFPIFAFYHVSLLQIYHFQLQVRKKPFKCTVKLILKYRNSLCTCAPKYIAGI